MPCVSVIIPAYNAEAFISQTLDSVLAQTLEDFELIVVDDGSADATASIVEGYAARDGRVSLLRQANSFGGVARNTGMAHASGEYFYFLDADDLVEPDALRTLVAGARRCDADVVVCRSRKFDTDTGDTETIHYALRDWPLETPLSQQQVAATLFRSVVGWPWDKLFRADFIRETGLLFQPLRSTNDAYFVFMALACAHTTYCVPQTLVSHRVNNLASTSNTRHASPQNALIAAQAIGEELRRRGLYELFERTYVNWLVNFTKWNLDTLDDDSALSLIRSARLLLADVPTSESFYFLDEDRRFAQRLSMDADELLLCTARLEQDCRRARAIYSSKAYKLGLKFVKPLKFVKYRVLKRS